MNIKEYLERERSDINKLNILKYYKWEHWTHNSGVLFDKKAKNVQSDYIHPVTTLGKRVFDRVDPFPKKVYNRSTFNLIKEWVDTMDYLLQGEGYLPVFDILENDLNKKYETIEKLYSYNFFDSFEELRYSTYFFWKSILFFWKLVEEEEVGFKSFDALWSYKDNNQYFLSFLYKEDGKQYHYRITEEIVELYSDSGRFIRTIPSKLNKDFFLFDFSYKPMLTRNSLELQDEVNIIYTQASHKLKNWMEPKAFITWLKNSEATSLFWKNKILGSLKEDTINEIKSWSWSVTILPGENTSVQLLQTGGLDDFILQHIRSLRNDLFGSMYLSWIKTEKDGYTEPRSWYSKELDTLQNQTYVSSLQSSLILFLQSIFDKLNENYSKEFPEDIDKQKNIYDKLKKDEQRKSKIETEEKRLELLTKKINFYIAMWKTREEAVEQAEKEVEAILD